MNTPGSKDILFWSPQCPYSRSLYNRIQNTPIMDRIILFNVHDSKYKLPPFVQAVPTLFLKVRRQALVNESLTQWIDQQIHYLANQQISSGNMAGGAQPAPTSNPNNSAGLLGNPNVGGYNQQNQNMPKKKEVTTHNDDLTGNNHKPQQITEFNPGEMSAGFSDSFSFIDNSDAVASHNFSFVGEADDTPPITGIKMSTSDMGDFPTQNNNSNSSGSNNNYSSGGNDLNYNPDPFANGGPPPNQDPFANNGPPPNQDPFANSGPSPNQGFGGGGYSGNDMSYNPDPFANNNSGGGFGSARETQKHQELDKRYEDLMKEREMNDSLAGLM
jgi:hypothetical protein